LTKLGVFAGLENSTANRVVGELRGSFTPPIERENMKGEKSKSSCRGKKKK